MGGTSAVNQYGGPYTAGDDGSFSVGEFASTMMAGPEPDMRAEQNYLTLLAEAKNYAVDGKTLTLSDANGNQSLIFTAATAASPSECRRCCRQSSANMRTEWMPRNKTRPSTR